MGFSEPKKADNDNVNDNNNSLSSAHTRENLGDISSETFDMDLDKCFADLKSEEGWLRNAWERHTGTDSGTSLWMNAKTNTLTCTIGS